MTDQIAQKIAFNLLPEAIQEWLNSDEVYEILLDIEKQFSIRSDQVRAIPSVIGELVTGNLSPSQTEIELKIRLKIGPEEALKITTIIKEKILNPIIGGLKLTTGIDLTSLAGENPTSDLPQLVQEIEEFEKLGQTPAPGLPSATPTAPASVPTSAPSPAPVRPSGTTPLSVQKINDVKAPQPKPVTASAPIPASKVSSAPKPFMLHEEKPVPTTPSYAAKPSFSYEPPSRTNYQPAQKPMSAQVNSSFEDITLGRPAAPKAPITARTPEEEVPKIVHYAPYRTPIDEQGNSKNVN